MNPVAHLSHIQPFLAMEIFARAQQLEAQGQDIIHLEFGEPDFPTPEVVSEAGIAAIRNKETHYTSTLGIPEFRDAVVAKYQRSFNVNLTRDMVLASNGTSFLLYLAVRLLVPPGKDLLITDPCYSCYDNIAQVAGVNPVRAKIHVEEGFQLSIKEVKRVLTKDTKAILLNSPMNPTGTVLSDENWREICSLGIPIISDEIYSDLIYEGTARSALNFTDQAIVLNGFAKFYSMTGWRLGYTIMPKEWMKVAARIHQNLMISANNFVQKAGTVALNQSEPACLHMKDEFNKRRKFLLQRLKEIGLDPGYVPNAAFYVFFRYPDSQMTSLQKAMDILDKTGVALVPGIDFGPNGEGFLRFSYANSLPKIDEAVKRLEAYFFGKK